MTGLTPILLLISSNPRLKISGSGVVAGPALGRDFGIPEWVDEVDDDDPPVWESELAYLKRHGLVLPGEERRAE